MNEYEQRLKSPGLEIPEILLPKSDNISKWPVIACDQFTRDREYWNRLKAEIGGAPSALELVFPEIFLGDTDAAERITCIRSSMSRYLNEGVFREPVRGFIYVERDTPYFKKRRGLVAAIDLEKYEWQPEARPLIRCTEGTVTERLPPRINIRRGAQLELPHVLLLIDDEKDSLLPSLAKRAQKAAPLYNCGLMMNSGNVRGWLLNSADDMSYIAEYLNELYSLSINRYTHEGQPFLFAVGDGNHSLACAKEIWEEYKKSHPGQTDQRCRYALAEIENIYDPAIQFEPIHRFVSGAGFDEIHSVLSQLPDFASRNINNAGELLTLCAQTCPGGRFGLVSRDRYALIETSAAGIATACLQPLLDRFTAGKPEIIDYIHDSDELLRLSNNTDAKSTGILLPPVQKSGLFDTVASLGPLPRKSFSMGHACEKRFYLECRRLSG
ncbi:MAG: DUF1015 domain-containing protein [Treponema sp.]|jgi:hypothetical protein|nr:DUF1015 domain-containing protein [Treponema sp.]